MRDPLWTSPALAILDLIIISDPSLPSCPTFLHQPARRWLMTHRHTCKPKQTRMQTHTQINRKNTQIQRHTSKHTETEMQTQSHTQHNLTAISQHHQAAKVFYMKHFQRYLQIFSGSYNIKCFQKI